MDANAGCLIGRCSSRVMWAMSQRKIIRGLLFATNSARDWWARRGDGGLEDRKCCYHILSQGIVLDWIVLYCIVCYVVRSAFLRVPVSHLLALMLKQGTASASAVWWLVTSTLPYLILSAFRLITHKSAQPAIRNSHAHRVLSLLMPSSDHFDRDRVQIAQHIQRYGHILLTAFLLSVSLWIDYLHLMRGC